MSDRKLVGGKTFFFFLSFIVYCTASAHPVPYKDAVAITALNQSYQTDMNIAYSFRRNAAIAARLISFENGIDTMNFYGTQLNFLLQRWNGDGFQANNYFSVALGPMNYNRHEHSTILTAIEGDIESRQLLLSGKAEKMWTGVGYDFWHLQSRIGGSPYAAGFKQLATWIMIQYEYNPILQERYRITPLVRMYYQNYLFETGMSNKGEWMLNLMIHI